MLSLIDICFLPGYCIVGDVEVKHRSESILYITDCSGYSGYPGNPKNTKHPGEPGYPKYSKYPCSSLCTNFVRRKQEVLDEMTVCLHILDCKIADCSVFSPKSCLLLPPEIEYFLVHHPIIKLRWYTTQFLTLDICGPWLYLLRICNFAGIPPL